MNVLKINSLGGASGDMMLGLLLDIGGDFNYLKEQVAKLIPEKECKIELSRAEQNGMHGNRVDVIVKESHHHHKHGQHDHHHHHRHFGNIKDMINDTDYSTYVKELAIKIFEEVAVAEAKVHGTTPEKVHFHEVGAVDSIVDIVGFAILYEQLAIDAVCFDELPVGCGSTTCQHGVIPVPVPATVEILKGMALNYTDEPFELVTPTGAAILKTVYNEAYRNVKGEIRVAGNSFGKRKLNKRPNMVRGLLLTVEDEAGTEFEEINVLECNIDDMSPEMVGGLFEKVLDEGAVDMTVTSCYMKKNRPGFMLSVLVDDSHKDRVKAMIFRETTTFGIREYQVKRTVLEREQINVSTVYGDISIKTGSYQGEVVTHSPEYDDCRKLADEQGVPVKDVYRAAVQK